jgi:glycosyltransferase involved in cell wall biosynthesis
VSAEHATTEIRVLVLAPYALHRAPSQRYRFEQYIEPLRREGIHLEASSFFAAAAMDVIYAPGRWTEKALWVALGVLRRVRDLLVAHRYDLVLVHREAWPVGLATVERLLQALRCPYVFEFDDAVYLSRSSDVNRPLARWKSGSKAKSIAAGAAGVIAGNEHLARWARRYSDRVTVIPTAVDTDAYRPMGANRKPGGTLCIGWTGSHSTVAHLRTLAPVLRDLQRERGVALRVIGDPRFRIEGAEVEALPWRESTEVEDLRQIDIGVMPLPDDEWSRGKCGLKALLYMAMGIPSVLSPVGVNTRIARGGAALLASTHEDWDRALRSLLDDPGARERLGEAGRRRVEEEYSTKIVASTYAAALRGAAATRVDAHR